MRAADLQPGYHVANELLVQQDSVPAGEFTPPVQEETQQAHPLNSSLADLINAR
jgi:hypothetical protein